MHRLGAGPQGYHSSLVLRVEAQNQSELDGLPQAAGPDAESPPLCPPAGGLGQGPLVSSERGEEPGVETQSALAKTALQV